jgi:endonuclease YncB( thermonuclease family)
MLRLLALPLALTLCLPAVVCADLFSYAHVQDDASLKIKGQTVHLDGIYIPPTDRDCQTNIRPVRCSSRAVLALEFKIQGFVRCEINSRNQDRSLNGTCYANSTNFDPGEDLAAYLLRRGWAVAAPGAPFEYQVLGEIAKEQERGIWGFSADRILR